MSFNVEPLNDANIGIKITDLDLSQPISEEDKKELYDAWIKAGIVVFEGLGHNDDEHKRLSAVFGELKPHAVSNLASDKENPEFMVLDSKEFEQIGTYYRDDDPDYVFTGFLPWHSDLIFTTRPNHGALLRVVEYPEKGGRTAWIDTIAAYNELDDSLKKRIEDVEFEYHLSQNFLDAPYGNDATMHAAKPTSGAGFHDLPSVAHPVVVTHPISGQKSLNVSPLHLVRALDMDEAEGDALIKELVAHVTHQRFSYVHNWKPNDMVLWDNWRTLHSALGYPAGARRRAVRTQVYGDVEMGRLI